ncbi:MAG: putative baseplate assembly protein, partial [Gammaproteobacteria bacterium]
MSAAWWGREALDSTPPDTADPPRLTTAGRQAIRTTIEARIAAFAPEWRQRSPGDAGDALLHLHSELAEPLLARINQLPEKLFREYLRAAGVSPTPARPAQAVLNFTVTATAPTSVLVPEGFQVSAPAADGSGERVVFETEQTLYAAPGDIAMTFVQEGTRFFPVELAGADPTASILAFGPSPRPGSALLFGLSSAVAPSPNIALCVQRAAGSGPPPFVAHGGAAPVATQPQPILRWSFLDGASFETAEVIRDETRGLTQSGLIELRCPRSWRTGTPSGVSAQQPLRWLRLQLVAGQFNTPPALAFVQLNTVRAVAARTVRNEVLEYVPDSDARRLRLSQLPVQPHSSPPP